mmetsp:Transcript_28106/g.66499  ORF Transcript_28106/g.66499 Transcript_28106/m.66499 type:complete len:166 (-) Transcript_28106:1509-2006(-)
MNDLHAYDTASGSWMDLSSPRAGAPPSARYRMGFTASVGKLYIFGGHGSGAQLMNDLHMYDIASGSWTDLTAPLDITRPLEREHMGFAEWSGKLYVFGGYSGGNVMNDLYEYDIAPGTWSDLSSPKFGLPPAPQRWHTRLAASAGKLYVFGGASGSMTCRSPRSD